MRSANTALSLPTLRDQRVVVLESAPDGMASLAAVLREDGYLVESYGTGAEVLERLQERPADIAVIDVAGHGREGIELCRSLRDDPLLPHVAVVSVLEQGGALERVYSDTSLVRPFAPGDLLLGVERALLRAERRSLIARLEEAERLAVLGGLAAGVGHELNNPLAFAIGNLELAEEAVVAMLGEPGAAAPRTRALAAPSPQLDTVVACLRDARFGLNRVRSLVGDFSALARRGRAEQKRLDLRRVLEASITMAKGQTADRAVVTCEFGEVPEILGDAARLEQLFVNLLVNAAQAIPMGTPASNSIHVALHERAGTVVVEIEDTGGGMSKAQLSRIFEPFFTTKGERGTGLGLTICRDIVDEHGGELHAESELGRGSRFIVRLRTAR